MKKLILLSVLLLFNMPLWADSGVNEKNVVLASKMKTGNYAVIVGIADYSSTTIADLEFTEKDATRFRDVLMEISSHREVMITQSSSGGLIMNSRFYSFFYSKEI